MLTDTPNETEVELEALETAITEAISKVREGNCIRLTNLEKRADSVCESILRLPSDLARPFSTKLEDMVSDLDTLKNLMLDQISAMKNDKPLSDIPR